MPRRAALTCGSLLLTGAASAQTNPTEPIPVALSFRAPKECESREDLMSRVRERSQRVAFESGAGAKPLDVSIEPGPPLVATVNLPSGDDPTPRRLSGTSCDELLDAVALVIVVTLDPTGQWSDEEARATPSPAPSAPAALDEPSAPVAERGEPRPATTRASAPQTAAELEPSTPATTAEPTPPDLPSPFAGASWVPDRVGLLGAGRAHHGPAPNPLLGPALGAELRFAGEQLVSLRIAVLAGRSWSERFERAEGSADFVLDEASAELCPLRFGTARWELRPCLVGGYGRMIARGSDTLEAREEQRPWGAVGAAARFEVELPTSLALWSSFTVSVPTVRDRYAFAPVTFYEVPAQGFSLGLGLSFYLPVGQAE